MDVRCWRCTLKLFVNESAVGSLTIKCDRCKAINRVVLDKAGATVG